MRKSRKIYKTLYLFLNVKAIKWLKYLMAILAVPCYDNRKTKEIDIKWLIKQEEPWMDRKRKKDACTAVKK